jgi:hypothetical protein
MGRGTGALQARAGAVQRSSLRRPKHQVNAFDIRYEIAPVTVSTIFGSQQKAVEFLHLLAQQRGQAWPAFRDQAMAKIGSPRPVRQAAFELVAATWSYDEARQVIREMFRQSPKYQQGRQARTQLAQYLAEWQELDLGPLDWPVSQGRYDQHLQSVNAQQLSGVEKDEIVKASAVRLRRMKEINTARNDYLETVVFDASDQVIPTFGNTLGVDFFIHGFAVDQKVSRSVTNEFKRDFGPEWRERALSEPATVARYLYEQQDEGRFSEQRQLQLVFLDNDVPAEAIAQQIQALDLEHPHEVQFRYRRSGEAKPRNYTTFAQTLLIHHSDADQSNAVQLS